MRAAAVLVVVVLLASCVTAPRPRDSSRDLFAEWEVS
jgi:hypothetical protein